jgi:hypothetical protein
MDDWYYLSVHDTLIEADISSHALPTQQPLLLDATQHDNSPVFIGLLPVDDATVTKHELMSLQNTTTNKSNRLMIKHLVEDLVEDIVENCLVHIIQNKQFTDIKHNEVIPLSNLSVDAAHIPLLSIADETTDKKTYKTIDDSGNTNGVCGVDISIPGNIDYNLECIRSVKKYSSFIFLVNSLNISCTSSITSKFKV